MNLPRTFTRLLLAWTPFFLLWVLFALSFMETDVEEALTSGAVSTVTAALLGLPIWRLTSRVPWPDRITLAFLGTQLAAGIPYAVLWTLSGYVAAAIEMEVSLPELIQNSQILGWRLLMGFWLYAIVAGVSYAVRNRHRVGEQERIAAHAEALALQARLASLRGQLNPHFLFNGLNSVTALIRHDPVQAERAVERLADLLRYSLDGGEQSMVALEDEWEFTRGYLEMQRLRFGDRLYFEMDADQQALARSVPPFVLQPLVENAVEHAIGPRTLGGKVLIRAAIDERGLVLSVEDDGPGLRDGSVRPGHGHGLSTLQARLEATYGDASLLQLGKSDLGGLSAVVVIRDGVPAPEFISSRR